MLWPLAWVGITVLTLVAWVICLHRFRVALRRGGAPLMSEWERLETAEWARRFHDDVALLHQVLQRQVIPAAERWRRASILMFALFLANLVAPLLLRLLF